MKPAARRLFGLVTGVLLGGGLVAYSSEYGLHRPGPMNTGHAELACSSCHRSAPGTIRQQLQNAARHALGMSGGPIDVGFAPVTSDDCIACHERPEDRHPVYRFLEPRFAEARAAIHPERCVSCHHEHSGTRVSLADTTFCRHCHADTTVENDPLDISHRTLIATQQWTSCLGCHDFHGNHGVQSPHRVNQAIDSHLIERYFAGGPSPYPPPVVRAIQRKDTSP